MKIDTFRAHAGGIVAFTMVLALLYFGRDVLTPLTVALMLSLLVAPLVRALRRIGLGQTTSVLAAVLMFTVVLTTTAMVLGTQVLRLAASLPQYEKTIQQKLQELNAMTVGRLNTLTGEASRLIESHAVGAESSAPALIAPVPTLVAPQNPILAATAHPVPVELHEAPAGPFQIIGRVVSSVWAPVATTGIVFVVLVFVLLEQEALRDRFIRIAGGANIRLTTLALNDAGTRLSRFFVSQFVVNLGVGVAIALGVAAFGLPHAALWGALATILRFVPYVGIWVAAFLSTALAIAVVPGWALAVSTLGLFIVVELIAGQAVEPHLYGHTTGLSPLSVVVAALFWSALWGPIGLILSTPLTLCLLVMGRHIKALSFLELLLGDTQALTLAQKCYQRALSGDAHEIIVLARPFIKRNSFAAYCDVVLLPAMHLGVLDHEIGAISRDQQMNMRAVLVTVVSALAGEKAGRSWGRRGTSVLDDSSSGTILRRQREQLMGQWQGPLAVPPGSLMLCIGLGSVADTLAAELLVRALREQKLDARHIAMEDLDPTSPPPGSDPASVAVVYLVSAFPGFESENDGRLATRLRELLPRAVLVIVALPGIAGHRDSLPQIGDADYTASSLDEAVRICLERRSEGLS